MLRRSFLQAAATAPFLHASPRRPNIVFIMADDLGYGDFGCFGQKIIRTPNIDRVASEGTRFTDAYAGCTVCAPSRSVLMTGKHTGHTSVRSNPGGVPILASDVTVGQVLKQAGYATGCFGKWGLGDIGTEGVPWKHGFDEFCGFLHQVHAHYHWAPAIFHNDREMPLAANRGGAHGTYVNDAVAEKGLEFIRRSKDGPFFCYMPLTVPHWEPQAPEDAMAPYRPIVPEPKPFIDKTGRLERQDAPRAAFAGMVSRFDSYVGRVTALLDELKLASNTIIFVTSDNGAAMPSQDPEDYFNSSGGLRGTKTTMYEGGLRAPMIVRWPGRVARGRVNDFAWMFQDVMPTLAELAGAKAPKDIDGVSVVPMLLGRKQRPHEFLYWEFPGYNWGTGEFRDEIPMQAVRMGEWKAVRPKPNASLELYNLRRDRAESTDLAAKEPKVLARIEEYLKTARVPPRPQKQPPHGWNKRPV